MKKQEFLVYTESILFIADSYLQISDLCIMLLPLIDELATNSSIHTHKKMLYINLQLKPLIVTQEKFTASVIYL